MVKNEAHARYDKKLHFLLCGPHIQDEDNKQLFQEFKEEVLTAEWQKKMFENNSYIVRHHKTFLEKKVKRVRFPEPGNDDKTGDDVLPSDVDSECNGVNTDIVAHTVPGNCEELEDAANFGPPVFLLQPITFADEMFNLMFDGGCQKFVCRKNAVDRFSLIIVSHLLCLVL